MRSCTCMRTPFKYVTEPKKPVDLHSEFSNSSKEAQSIVTDSEVFDHEALLKHEGSTDYEDESPAVMSAASSSSMETETEADQKPESRPAPTVQESDESHSENKGHPTELSEEDTMGLVDDERLRNTVEKWNELLNKYDEEPDLAELQEVLTMVSKLSEAQDDETKKQVADTIKRLTNSLVEATSMPESVDTEVVLQECVGEEDETYFRCFVRKLREQAGNKVELEVNELVSENIRVLFNSLGLLRRNRSVDGNNLLTRMSSTIKGYTVFKNLYPEAVKTPMDLTTYLRQLSEKVDRDDLASVSTLSELEMNRHDNSFSNCLISTSQCCDESVLRLIRDQNTKIAAFCVEQVKKQSMLRNKYEDLSDQPLFII